MNDSEFDASSLEEPDNAPDQTGSTDPITETDEPSPEEPVDGSTLEKNDDALYVRKGSLQRRPKYGAFGVVGGLLGLVLGLVLAQVGSIPGGQDYTRLDLSIVLVGLGVPTGILLALVIALFLDRRRK